MSPIEARHERVKFYTKSLLDLKERADLSVRRGVPEGLVTTKKIARNVFYFEILCAYADLVKRHNQNDNTPAEEAPPSP